MAPTRSFRDTVADRMESSPGFRAALVEEAAAALAEGDTETARTLLQDVPPPDAAPLPRRPPPTSLTVSLEAGQANRFRGWARARGGVSAALRQLVATAMGDGSPAPPPGPGTGQQVGVRLRADEQAALAAAAAARGMTPSGWLRALACAQLLRRPRWGDAERDALHGADHELRLIRFEVNRVAEGLAAAARVHPTQARFRQERAAAEALTVARDVPALVEIQLRRIEALVRGNLDYWAVPLAEQPGANPE